ncbi:MAG: hemerythrin domain-containing protein [Gammaproteobacteria bacterium]|nr:hemerythrin domain-containing protein [Gammaproteobacteria bacterium]
MLQISSPSDNKPETHKGAPFEQPIELLLSCHEKILHFSSSLLKLSHALKENGWSDELKTSSDKIRKYFNIAGPEHHLDEENHLFPAIIALDPEFKKPESASILKLLHRLIQEHVESDLLWETLDQMLDEQSEDFDLLEELSQEFESSMHEHAKVENEEIFPYAKENLSTEILRDIGLSIAKRRGVPLELIPD